MVKLSLTQGQFALVDECDAHLVAWRWCAYRNPHTKTYYAVRGFTLTNGRTRTMPLHHAIMGRPLNGLVVDHIDGNSLNNTRKNLRIVTNRENISNNRNRRAGETSSQFVGVVWSKNLQKWKAVIRIKGKDNFLGYHHVETAARDAYQSALKEFERAG